MCSHRFKRNIHTGRAKFAFVEVDAHGMKIRIHENTSSSLIQKVLGAVVHVE